MRSEHAVPAQRDRATDVAVERLPCDSGARVVLHGSPATVRAALGLTLEALEPPYLPPPARQTLELVLAEVLNNIVEHAYAELPNGRIELLVQRDGDAIACETLDDGAPMPGGDLPNLPPPCPTDAPQGGFGWMLIRSLARDLCYARAGRRNRLRFRLPIDAGVSG